MEEETEGGGRERKKRKTREEVFHTGECRTASSDLTNGLLTVFLMHLSCKPVCV